MLGAELVRGQYVPDSDTAPVVEHHIYSAPDFDSVGSIYSDVSEGEPSMPDRQDKR